MTNQSRRVLAIYDDAPVFGGHEQMSCCGIEALCRESDLNLVCLVARENQKLIDKLESIQAENLTVVMLDFSSRRFQGIRSRFEKGKIRQVCEKLQRFKAASLLVLQGDIELSSIGVEAGKALAIPTTSYIPVPHTLETMKAKLGRFRDPFNRWLFDRPDAFITISEGMKSLLQERGAQQEIDVVLNGFVASKTEIRDREAARTALGLPLDPQLIAMVGRVEYKQKRQDFLLQTLAANQSILPNVHLLFVGSGPDESDLKAQAKALGVNSKTSFLSWTDGLSDVYSSIDLLALPSRFEGVPLVMLEAMSANLPIVACARDGMKEFLPAEWLFPPGNKDACAQTLAAVLKSDASQLVASNREMARTQFSLENFERSFVASVRRLGGLGVASGG